jgi:hypothetical protein
MIICLYRDESDQGLLHDERHDEHHKPRAQEDCERGVVEPLPNDF